MTREFSNSFKFRRVAPSRWWHDALRPLVRITFFARLLDSSTGFSGSDLEVAPLPPPLVMFDIAYLVIRHAYCPGSRGLPLIT